MFLRFEAALGGNNFSDIAPEVLLRDIVEMPAETDVSVSRRGYKAGQRFTGKIRTALSVRLVYRIRAYDIERRATVRDLIAQWANAGGWLTVNTRPGKRLYVKTAELPYVDSSLKWNQDLSLTLTAYEQPYWEDVDEVTVSCEATWSNTYEQYYAANVIAPTGNMGKVPLTLSVINTSESDEVLTHLKIVADETFFAFEGLALESGLLAGWIFAEYDENDVLSIHDLRNDGSLLANRTAESNDDLLVRCGKDNQLHVYADAPCKVFFNARGRWL